MTCRTLTLLTALALAPTAHGGITLLSGEVQLIAPPFSVQEDAIQNNQTASLFAEQQNLLLTAPLAIDISSGGVFNETIDLTPNLIPAGTLVNSYLVVADSTGVNRTFIGTIQFDEPILVIVMSQASLQASHAVVGFQGIVAYPVNGSSDASRAESRFGAGKNQFTLNPMAHHLEFASGIDGSTFDVT